MSVSRTRRLSTNVRPCEGIGTKPSMPRSLIYCRDQVRADGRPAVRAGTRAAADAVAAGRRSAGGGTGADRAAADAVAAAAAERCGGHDVPTDAADAAAVVAADAAAARDTGGAVADTDAAADVRSAPAAAPARCAPP